MKKKIWLGLPTRCGWWWVHQAGQPKIVKVVEKWGEFCVDFDGVFIPVSAIRCRWQEVVEPKW